MFKRARKITFLFAVIGISSALVFLWNKAANKGDSPSGDSSAVYKGKLVSDWVGSIHTPSLKMNPQILTVVEIGKPAVPFLIKRLRDPSSVLTRSDSYKWIWNRMPQIVQRKLTRPAPHRTERERVIRATAFTLRKMGVVAKDAIVPLMRTAEDPLLTRITREYAVQALWHMGAEVRIIMPDLMECLKKTVKRIQDASEDETTLSQELSLCCSMVHSLARIGGDYSPVVPQLRLLSAHSDPDIKACSVVSLWCLEGRDEFKNRIISILQSSDSKLNGFAIAYLGNIGPPAAEFLPELSSIEKESGVLQEAAVHAIGKISSTANGDGSDKISDNDLNSVP